MIHPDGSLTIQRKIGLGGLSRIEEVDIAWCTGIMSTAQAEIAQKPATNAPTEHPTHWPLPTPPGAAVPLVLADFQNAAKELGVETAAIRAVAGVESGGRHGFDARKRPVLRYENHIFRSLTNRQFDRS